MLRFIERFRRRALPEPASHASAHTPLARLPVIAIDTETTGLDPRRDRIVSVAAVRIEGLAVDPVPALDRLVDPGVPIPVHSTHIHGISDAQVAGAPRFADVHGELRHVIDGAVIVGHLVGFDLAVLAAEARRSGLPWRRPLFLDTARLTAALDPRHRHLDLVDLLRAYGVESGGRRHNAADDARMAAELYVAVARRLIGQGRGSFGGAQDL